MVKKNAIKQSEISMVSQLLNKDYYKDNNDEVFQNVLRKIKPFKNIPKDEEISLELLEKLIYKYECKYDIMINYICPTYIPDERRMYSVTFRNTNKKVIKEFTRVYGSTIYELYIKIALFYYLEITLEQNITLKDWGKRYE